MMFSDDMGIMTFSAAELQLFPLRETESARGGTGKVPADFSYSSE
jgi:hypothetical protein